jgi:hypothetical protein
VNITSYVPATDDLYLYGAGNSGFPIGWNPSHALYPFRESLQWIGVAARQVAVGPDAFDYLDGDFGVPPEPPGGTPLAQLPNWFTPRYPSLSFVSPRLAVGAMHFWFSLQINRVRPTVNDLWSLPPLRWLTADGTLVSRANADFLGPYNQLAGGVQVAPPDAGVCEYQGALPAVGCSLPAFSIEEPLDRISIDDLDLWIIERQGRAIRGTITEIRRMQYASGATASPIARGREFAITNERVTGVYVGDSGAAVVAIKDGTVHLVSHAFQGWAIGTTQAIDTRIYAAGRVLPDRSWFVGDRAWPVNGRQWQNDYTVARRSSMVAVGDDFRAAARRFV